MRTKSLPEDTGLGISLLPKNSNIKNDYLKHIISNKSKYDLGYEFRYNRDIIPVFIVGREEEKELPLIRFPIVVTTNDVNYIVSNLMGTTKSDLSNSLLSSKKTDFVDFETTRNMLMYYSLAEKDVSYLVSMTAQLATSVLTKVISQHLRLDTFSTIDLEGAVFYYFLNRYGEFNNESIKTKMLNLLSIGYRNNVNAVDICIRNLSNLDKDSSISDFINANAGDNNTLRNIDTKAILSMLSNLWFSGSENSAIQMYMAIENFHTMAAILHHTLVTPTGKKTTLNKMLMDAKRSLRIDNFLSDISGKIKDSTI
jgi:hypothetical protein